jgi:Fe-S-cluster containining protein
MVDDTATDDAPLPAGAFGAWLRDMQAALRGERDADVPCGGCTACCAASQFVPIAPDERDTLAAIPRELLFPAPGQPDGHVVLGYDEHGRCPMLTGTGCSIYAHRPRTCRTYDCRVFPAAGVVPDDSDGPVARRARRWRFEFPTERDRRERDAVCAAADDARRRADVAAAKTATGVAVLAVRAADVAVSHG